MQQEDAVTFVKNVVETMEVTCESQENNNEEIINASFVSENGEVINLNVSIIDKDTLIYKVLESDKFPMRAFNTRRPIIYQH